LQSQPHKTIVDSQSGKLLSPLKCFTGVWKSEEKFGLDFMTDCYDTGSC